MAAPANRRPPLTSVIVQLHLSLLQAFALDYGLLAILPGPNAFIVARAALAGPPGAGLRTAAGVGLGAGTLALGAALGSGALAGLGAGTRLLPGLFGSLLLLLGLRTALRSLRGPGAFRPPAPRRSLPLSDFLTGFLAAATNPVSAAFFLASAARLQAAGVESLLPPAPCMSVALGFAVVALLVAGSWATCLALGAATPVVRGFQLRHARALSLVTAALLIASGMSTIGLPRIF